MAAAPLVVALVVLAVALGVGVLLLVVWSSRR